MALSWFDVISLVLGAGATSAVLTAGRDWWKESASSRKAARYAALRIAVALEKFALECAELIEDQEIFDSSHGHAGKQHGNLPFFESYPLDIDWRVLKPDFASSALSVPIELISASRTIAFMWEIAPGESDTCTAEAARCGLRMWDLAKKMRAHYQLPPVDLTHYGKWEPIKSLSKRHAVANSKPAATSDVV